AGGIAMGARLPAFGWIGLYIPVIVISYRDEKKALFLAWDSVAIVLIYLGNLMLLYMLRPQT
ncbi:MAG: hypothetical protein M0Z60_07130, partial [Nitrospiraceae bacterium]|nr:hypothetical protein [Nitrospiraceae bacterium]